MAQPLILDRLPRKQSHYQLVVQRLRDAASRAPPTHRGQWRIRRCCRWATRPTRGSTGPSVAAARRAMHEHLSMTRHHHPGLAH